MTTDVPPAGDHASAPLVVRTVLLDLDTAEALVGLLPADGPLAWVRREQGLVGWGSAAVVRTQGTARFTDADKWWTETAARAEVHDEVGEPGTGLVCFGSFGFTPDPGDSVLVVPQVVVGRRGDVAWLTTVSEGGSPPPEDGARWRCGRPSHPRPRPASASPTAPSTATSG